MIQQLNHQCGLSDRSMVFKPERPTQVKPSIVKEYRQDGQRMYQANDGRRFLADVFDRVWNHRYSRKIKPKNTKGDNCNYKLLHV